MKYFFITILSFLFIAASVSAAALTVTAPVKAAVGEQIAIDVIADTGGTAINSVEAALQYPSDLLTFAGYQETAGVVRFWITPPVASNGIVSFAGGIPGGADRSVGGNSSSLVLVRLLFTAKNGGSATLAFDHSTLLKNDGKGTELAHTATGAVISIAATADTTAIAAAAGDTAPPEPFPIQYIPRDRANGTPALIAFSTTDRDSGISSYQVKLGWGKWRDTASPYPVRPHLFSYTAKVRAVDAHGNSQSSRSIIPGIMPVWLAAAVLAVLGGGYYAYFVVKKKV